MGVRKVGTVGRLCSRSDRDDSGGEILRIWKKAETPVSLQ